MRDLTIKETQKIDYTVISIIDLMSIYNKNISEEDIRKEFLEIGYFNPINYINFLKDNKDIKKELNISIRNIGKLNLDFRSSNSKIYRTLSILSQHLNLKFLFTIPLVAKSNWHELPENKNFLYREIIEIHPLFAIYSCKFRKKSVTFFNPNEIQEINSITGSLNNYFIKQFTKLKKRVKISILSAIFPKFKDNFSKKIFLLDSPPCVVIFAENISKRELKPLKNATITGQSGFKENKKKWEFQRDINTIMIFGEKIEYSYKNKMLFSVKMLNLQRNHRKIFSKNIANYLIEVLKINYCEKDSLKTNIFNSLEKWETNHYLIYSVLFNTFQIVYNDKFYYKTDIVPILSKGYMRNFFSVMSDELKIDISFIDHFKQIIGSIKVVNPLLFQIMLESCYHGFFSLEKQILLKSINKSIQMENPELIELNNEQQEIIDYLMERFLTKFKDLIAISAEHYEFESLWPCGSRNEIIERTSMTKYHIYEEDSPKYVKIINTLKFMNIIKIKNNPKYSKHSESQKFKLICLNLENPFVKARILPKMQEIVKRSN